MMKKKKVVAVYLSKNEKIHKLWIKDVSYDIEMIDITVPENTLYSFFTTNEKADLKVTEKKLSKNNSSVWVKGYKDLIHDNKIYCYGCRKGLNLVVTNSKEQIYLNEFFKFINKNLIVEFI